MHIYNPTRNLTHARERYIFYFENRNNLEYETFRRYDEIRCSAMHRAEVALSTRGARYTPLKLIQTALELKVFWPSPPSSKSHLHDIFRRNLHVWVRDTTTRKCVAPLFSPPLLPFSFSLFLPSFIFIYTLFWPARFLQILCRVFARVA